MSETGTEPYGRNPLMHALPLLEQWNKLSPAERAAAYRAWLAMQDAGE